MHPENGQRPILELYNRYNREDILKELGYSAGSVILLGVTGLLATHTDPHLGFHTDGTVLSVNYNELYDSASKVIAAGTALVTEVGVGFVLGKRSDRRQSDVASEIARLEGRVPDENNNRQIRWTYDLTSTLVYGINYSDSRLNRFINSNFRPLRERTIPVVRPERRVAATFRSFDSGVESLLVEEWQRDGIAVNALNLGRERWEEIRDGKGSERLRGYSFAMLSEINRRLGKPLS